MKKLVDIIEASYDEHTDDVRWLDGLLRAASSLIS